MMACSVCGVLPLAINTSTTYYTPVPGDAGVTSPRSSGRSISRSTRSEYDYPVRSRRA